MATQTTPLTVNSNSTVTYNTNPNNAVSVTFSYLNNLLWATMLSNTSTSQTLTDDATAGPVTLNAGAKVDLQLLGSTLNVLFTGTIIDSGSANSFKSTKIATFSAS